MANQNLYDLVIYDINQLGLDPIRAEIGQWLGRGVQVAIISTLPLADLEHRLRSKSMNLPCIHRFCDEDLKKALGHAMANRHIVKNRVCYIGNSPDVAREMRIGKVIEIKEFFRLSRRPARLRAGI